MARKRSSKQHMGSLKRKRRTRALRARDGDLCYLCGVVMDFEDRTGEMAATIDHVNPIVYGGGHDLENLKLAHRFCNGDRDHVRKHHDGKKWKALNAQLKEIFK